MGEVTDLGQLLGTLDIDAAFDELLGQLTPDDLPEPDLIDAPSEELVEVARRVSTQYVEVVAAVSSQLLAGGGLGALDPLEGALGSLRRLAEVRQDAVTVGLIDEISFAAALWRAGGAGRGPTVRFLDQLREWLPRMGRALGASEGNRLLQLTEYDGRRLPLFAELEGMRGVGPRRLRRLYCAGLFSVDALSTADPVEVSQVTGLPRELAAQIVERTRVFAEEHRRRSITSMRQQLNEFARLVQDLDPRREPELARIARNAVLEMRRLLHEELRGGNHETG